jgi:hypothetical protein
MSGFDLSLNFIVLNMLNIFTSILQTNYHLCQSVVHIREVDYLFCLVWEFDFTHINEHTKKITSCILCTYRSCLTSFVRGFIWILKLGNA